MKNAGESLDVMREIRVTLFSSFSSGEEKKIHFEFDRQYFIMHSGPPGAGC